MYIRARTNIRARTVLPDVLFHALVRDDDRWRHARPTCARVPTRYLLNTHALIAPPCEEEKTGTRHTSFSLHHRCHGDTATLSSTREDSSAWWKAGGLFIRRLLHVRAWGGFNVLMEMREKKLRSMNRPWQIGQMEANEWQKTKPFTATCAGQHGV